MKTVNFTSHVEEFEKSLQHQDYTHKLTIECKSKKEADRIVFMANNHSFLVEAIRDALNSVYALRDYAQKNEGREAIVEQNIIDGLKIAIKQAETK